MRVLLIGAICFGLAAATQAQRAVQRDLLVAAAASLSAVAPELTRAVHDATGIDVRFNFAASNTLARQIVEGARVDAFISADAAQMDVVERAGRLVADSRADIISNQLVIVSSDASPLRTLRPGDLATASIRRIAMGDPAAVPAGVYGRQWLENIRLWSAVASKVIPLPSSPGVVAAVAEGRADVGIVYMSDARTRRGIVVAHHVGVSDAPRIVYPAAAVVGGRVTMAREFLAFLRSDAARRVFEAAGFQPVR